MSRCGQGIHWKEALAQFSSRYACHTFICTRRIISSSLLSALKNATQAGTSNVGGGGSVSVLAGMSASGSSGTLSLSTGTAAYATSGAISLTSGDGGMSSGAIALRTGTSNEVAGSIFLGTGNDLLSRRLVFSFVLNIVLIIITLHYVNPPSRNISKWCWCHH